VPVNIEIMRTFVRLRAMTADNKALARRLNKFESKYDKQFAVVFDAIRAMMVTFVSQCEKKSLPKTVVATLALLLMRLPAYKAE